MALPTRLLPLLLAGCTHLAPPAQIAPDDLKAALAYGQRIDLDARDPAIEKNLSLRLYAVPQVGGDCFVETHGVCANTYYLSVSTFDEYPLANVFRLTHEGEVRDVRWREDATVDQATIDVTMDRYTAAARKNNPALPDIRHGLVLTVTPTALIETVR
ncbi:hypothetical protein [Denitromonas iodatirespirans]|uniref:Uncharacterized protein n=1 Tax=Denitromonas iodatirespirans TaxID=2795389 RepID=A0A944H7A6_DENI1|nr:hypothetical protein [Denitromonas iodatirespirans]MBT0961028.1 hypothetical protein [Denitromonas iodatirespirans]